MVRQRTYAFPRPATCALLGAALLFTLAASCSQKPSQPPAQQPHAVRREGEASGGARGAGAADEDGQWVMPAKNYASIRYSGLE